MSHFVTSLVGRGKRIAGVENKEKEGGVEHWVFPIFEKRILGRQKHRKPIKMSLYFNGGTKL